MTLAIDIGGTNTKVAFVDPEGSIDGFESFPTAEQGFVQCLIAIARERRPVRIGVAVAGFLDHRRDRLVYNPNLPWLEQLPLKQELEQASGVEVTLEVDSNAACLAEYRFGVGKDIDRFMSLSVGTGIGLGMTVGGRLVRFAYECMGDGGHVIVDPHGPVCACGGKGCAEVLVTEAARAQNYLLAGRWLGIAMATLSTIFYPERIAISGGIAESGDVFIDAARQSMQSVAPPFASQRTDVVHARLGKHATLIGAACVESPAA